MPTTTTGLATSFITFSRPGASGGGATVTDADGKIKWAGHNLLTNSESFDASAWAKVNATVTANNAVGPNSTTTADTVVATAVSGGHRVQQTVTLPASGSVVVFAKAAGYNWILVQATDASNGCGYWFNVSTGAVGTQNAFGTGFTASNPVVTSVGNGWYKCELAYTSGGTGTTIIINVTNSDNVSSFLGDGTSGVAIWGAHLYRSDLGGMQLNPAMPAGMQSYYPTTAANRLGYTEDFSNAAWVKTSSTVTADTTASPNGLNTADTLTASAGTVFPQVLQGTPAYATAQMVSVYAKAGTYGILQLFNLYGAGFYANFNLSAGVVGTKGGGVTDSGMVALGNGWYRCWALFNSLDEFGIGLAGSTSATRQATWAAAGTESVYLWGAQLSDSALLDTYVPVYGAAVTSAAYYAPRLDFDGATLSPKGLLVEEQRGNSLLHSNAFDNAAWQKLGSVTVTADATTAPDGTSTADKLVSGNTTAQMYVGDQTVAVTSGITYSLSVFAKASEYNLVQLRFSNSAFSNAEYATFNLTTGSIAQSSGSGHTIVAVGNGWYRCTAIGVATSTTNAFPGINLATSASGGRNPTITGDGTSGLFLWGAQLEAGSFATSYIPTGASTATRTADVASVSTQAFPYSDTSGSYVVAFSPAVVDGNLIPISLTDGTANNRILSSNGVDSHLIVVAGNVFQANIDAGTVTAGAVNKIGAAFAANDFAATIGGGTVGTDTSGSVPIVNRMSIGNYNNASGYLNGHIRQITYIPRRLSNAELQSRTA